MKTVSIVGTNPATTSFLLGKTEIDNAGVMTKVPHPDIRRVGAANCFLHRDHLATVKMETTSTGTGAFCHTWLPIEWAAQRQTLGFEWLGDDSAATGSWIAVGSCRRGSLIPDPAQFQAGALKTIAGITAAAVHTAPAALLIAIRNQCLPDPTRVPDHCLPVPRPPRPASTQSAKRSVPVRPSFGTASRRGGTAEKAAQNRRGKGLSKPHRR
ncbi:hypothetical protein OSH11_01535 [Kaistia dalseonensis]|uniref:Uncharacterized protein n=1 Tax=Kaistia dalseonensis TaxID=410840 RepID=A0ABU0H0V0_9HYPH|nr:hypothetical protein [Kaistia dalseonensis]MCX5493377.1 hypothetical protein [Kaistia dalseonensis]MDQ0435935.1 hypothetical protein [Kaistia dalseonensis]